jgi:RsiW-degrading membrane proteinase PrsW (M82 family)
MDSTIYPQSTMPVVRRIAWLKILIVAGIFYVLVLGALLLTGNPNLFPTLVMVGNFMVPVAFVAFLYERRHLSRLTVTTVALAFLYGGLLGVVAASVLEPFFIRQLDVGGTLKVGLIEEFVKILGVLIIARGKRHDSEMDGLILGAAAGMGFAALESNGYAFTAFLASNGSLSATVFVTLLRGVLSPLGHGTWTAILASVLFRESRNGHFRIDLPVIGAYLLVSILHAMWDGLPSAITPMLGQGLDVFVVQGLIGLAGLIILWRRWREAVRLQAVMAPETEDI